jgi:hypothetical protein
LLQQYHIININKIQIVFPSRDRSNNHINLKRKNTIKIEQKIVSISIFLFIFYACHLESMVVKINWWISLIKLRYVYFIHIMLLSLCCKVASLYCQHWWLHLLKTTYYMIQNNILVRVNNFDSMSITLVHTKLHQNLWSWNFNIWSLHESRYKILYKPQSSNYLHM